MKKELADGVWAVGMETHGETAYLIQTEQKAILVGPVLAAAWEEARALAQGREIGWLVLTGMDRDRETLRLVRGAFEDVTVIANSTTLYALEVSGKAICVRGERALTLDGKTLVFQAVRTEKEALVLTVEDRENGLVLTRTEPLARCRPEELVQLAVAYLPGGGVDELAREILKGARDAGLERIAALDLEETGVRDAVRALSGAQVCLFGSCVRNGDVDETLWDTAARLRREQCRGGQAALFGSFFSAREGFDSLRQRLRSLGYETGLPDCLVQGRVDETARKNAYEYGYAVGCAARRIPNSRQRRLVKCLVCGEIFDASLGICPVCGVGLEYCEPADEETVEFRKNSSLRYVIAGGGCAAVAAAEAIRQRDGTGRIAMLSAENYLPIDRPMLSKDMELTARGAPAIALHEEGWYEERAVEVRLGCAVAAIDPAGKTVTTAAGERIPYDKLIIATGAECFVPPLPGCGKEGVMTIRHWEDNDKLFRLMLPGKRAVVIGGGVLGLETASELQRFGLSVTVLEAAPQIVGRQCDAASSAILKGRIEAMGVPVHEGVSVAEIEGEDRAEAVRLDDGRRFPADLVVISCGSRANIQLALQAGVKAGRAIEVDQFMQTDQPDVYACGDCAVFDAVNCQLWQEAGAQGRVAGANAAGDRVRYAAPLLGLSFEGFGTRMLAIGDPGKRTDIPYETVEIADGVRGRHETYWFSGGCLQGAVLINAPEKVHRVMQAVRVHARYEGSGG